MEFARPEHWDLVEESLSALSEPYGLEYWREKDARHEFPTELWGALGKNGWLGVSIPEEYGGQGMSFLDTVYVVETACRGGGGSTLSQLFMATPVFGGETIRRHGSDELHVAASTRLDRPVGRLGTAVLLFAGSTQEHP